MDRLDRRRPTVMNIYKYGLSQLKRCSDLSDVAALLDVRPKFMSKQIYHTPDSDKYQAFTIAKKDGSLRQIKAPNKHLKFMQSRLSRLLYQCYYDIHGKPSPSSALSHGFQKARDLSIYTNALRHTGRRYVLNVDISNFFDAPNFGRVRGFFIKNSRFELEDKAATCIAQLCCFENGLPQGAPSSPIVTELISQALDFRLQSLARKYRCTYSRYADDITFSTNLREFPISIAEAPSSSGPWTAGAALSKAVVKCGFDLNPSKTRMQILNQRQAVTGLTVNKKVNVPSKYFRAVRWCAHSMKTSGRASQLSIMKPNVNDLSVNRIWGMISHVLYVKSREVALHSGRLPQPHSTHPHYHKIAADYYHYLRVHRKIKPLLVCEGKTDYIYLKEAIRYNISDGRVSSILADPKKLPLPTSVGGEWGIDFLRHTKMAERLLGLGGGGGGLKNFVKPHLSRMERYHAIVPMLPTILVVDNDAQSAGMWAII